MKKRRHETMTRVNIVIYIRKRRSLKIKQPFPVLSLNAVALSANKPWAKYLIRSTQKKAPATPFKTRSFI